MFLHLHAGCLKFVSRVFHSLLIAHQHKTVLLKTAHMSVHLLSWLVSAILANRVDHSCCTQDFPLSMHVPCVQLLVYE